MNFLISGLIETFTVMAKGIMAFFIKDFWKEMSIAKVSYETGKMSGVDLAFNNYLPGAVGDDIQTIFKIIGLTIVLLLFFLNLAKAFLPQEVSQSIQHPFETVGRTIAGVIAVFSAYLIMAVIQTPMAIIFNSIYNIANNADKMQSNFSEGGGSALYGDHGTYDTYVDNVPDVDIPFFDGVDAIAGSFIILILTLAITWAFIQLIAEVIERYVVMCFLFYAAPVALSAVSSSSTQNIATSYLRMIFSQYLLMMFNVCFIYVFCYAFTYQNGGKDFESAQEAIIFYLVLLAWLKLGRSLDEHMRSLGLSTAQTGRGIASEAMFAGMMAMRTASSIAHGISKGAGMAKNFTQRAGGPGGGVENMSSAEVHARNVAANESAGRTAMIGSLGATSSMAQRIQSGGLSGVGDAKLAASKMLGIPEDKIASANIPQDFATNGITINGTDGSSAQVYPVANNSPDALRAAGIPENAPAATYTSGPNNEYTWAVSPTDNTFDANGIMAHAIKQNEIASELGASVENANGVGCYNMTADSSFEKKYHVPQGNYIVTDAELYPAPDVPFEETKINGRTLHFVNTETVKNYEPALKGSVTSSLDKAFKGKHQ